jgi:hypothetical protein
VYYFINKSLIGNRFSNGERKLEQKENIGTNQHNDEKGRKSHYKWIAFF